MDDVYFSKLRSDAEANYELSQYKLPYFVEEEMEEIYAGIKGFENAKIYGKSKNCYICSIGYPLASFKDGSTENHFYENMVVDKYVIYDISLSAVTEDYKIYSLYEAYKQGLIDIDEVVNSILPEDTMIDTLPDEVTLEKIEQILDNFGTDINIKQIGFAEQQTMSIYRYKFPVIGIFDSKKAMENHDDFCMEANVSDDDAYNPYTVARYAHFDLRVPVGKFDKYYKSFVSTD